MSLTRERCRFFVVKIMSNHEIMNTPRKFLQYDIVETIINLSIRIEFITNTLLVQKNL